MGKLIGYGKLGRSMPLSLTKCGNLGGDVECAAVVSELARRHPDDTFLLLGRNSGEHPEDVGLPKNVVNPWISWWPAIRANMDEDGLNHGNLTSAEQLTLAQIFATFTRDTFAACDAHVWWVGQHGTSNSPIPRVDDRSRLTKPQDWCAYYSSFVFLGLNAWQDVDPLNREPVYLNADPRNKHKMRDIKWPLRHPVLAQYNFDHQLKYERYGAGFDLYNTFYDRIGVHTGNGNSLGYYDEGQTWQATVHNVYSRLEVNGLAPGTPFGDLIKFNDKWEDRQHFGLFINEAGRWGRADMLRVNVFEEWIEPQRPAWVHGTWTKASLEKLEREIVPAPWASYYSLLHSVHATFTTPSSGSHWATAKPWEAFAAGTVCFFHPQYDTQDNILGDAPKSLREFLRVKSPAELAERIQLVHTEPVVWWDMITMQRRHFDEAIEQKRYLELIEERIYGRTT